MAITQTDIENVYGALNVAQWSQFYAGTQPTGDTARVAKSITWATALVESRLRNGPYTVPVVNADGTDDEVPEISDAKATLAGWWLWNSRGLNQAKETVAEMNRHYKRVMDLLRDIRTGMLPINAAYNTGRTTTPFVARMP